MVKIADGECFAVLRNVAHKPVQHECFINMYQNGRFSVVAWARREEADSFAERDRVECRRIVWNSDGSPVEDINLGDFSILQMENQGLRERISAVEKDNADLERDRDAWKAKAEALQAEVDGWRKWEVEIANPRITKLGRMYDELQAEVERMKPVVDAAVAWCDANYGEDREEVSRLVQSILIYQGEPEKSCENCANGPKFSIKCTAKICASAAGYGDVSFANWEPRR